MQLEFWTNFIDYCKENNWEDIIGFKPGGHNWYDIHVGAKATINLQAKSLKSYREKYEPEISIRTSLTNYEVNQGLFNMPLYSVENIPKVIVG